MDKRNYQKLAARVRALPPEVVLRAAAVCDGHTVLDPRAFLDAGLPMDVVDHLTRTHRSDPSHPKSTLFVDGRPVEELSGVYGLDALRFLADALGVAYARALGRGFEARNIRAALQRHLATPPGPRPPEV